MRTLSKLILLYWFWNYYTPKYTPFIRYWNAERGCRVMLLADEKHRLVRKRKDASTKNVEMWLFTAKEKKAELDHVMEHILFKRNCKIEAYKAAIEKFIKFQMENPILFTDEAKYLREKIANEMYEEQCERDRKSFWRNIIKQYKSKEKTGMGTHKNMKHTIEANKAKKAKRKPTSLLGKIILEAQDKGDEATKPVLKDFIKKPEESEEGTMKEGKNPENQELSRKETKDEKNFKDKIDELGLT